MKIPAALSICFLCLLTLTAPLHAGTPVQVSYSNRLIPNIDPPAPGFPEGGITATFSATGPVAPAVPDPDLVRIDDHTWSYTFTWNATATKIVDFIDGQGDTTRVEAWPQPVYPFAPAAHTVPVIHVRTDSTCLWDPATGIYVWGDFDNCLQHGDLWERPAVWDYYAGGDKPIFSEPIGLRINGGWSRKLDQKGLRFYFDDYGAADQIDYDFFGGSPASFRRLIVRSGRYPELIINSTVGEGVFQDLGHLGSRFAFTVLYLNREYWGACYLRERIDEEFIEHTWNLDDGGYILMKDGDPVHGDGAEFYDFLGFFGQPADYSSHAWFLDACSRFDLTTYMDWLIINIFGASADNGFDDNSFQLKTAGGKWLFLAWDEDDLFTVSNLFANHFRFYAAADEAEWNQFLPPTAWFGPWTPAIQEWCTMFNSLMHNSEFKARFADRVRRLLADELSVDALNQRLDAIVAAQQPELDQHFDRWQDEDTLGFGEYVDIVRWFFENRHPVVLDQLADFLEFFGVPVELSRFAATASGGRVEVTWRTERETDNQGFILYRSVDSPDDPVEIASYLTDPALAGHPGLDVPTDYAFTDTTAIPGRTCYYQLSHVAADGEVTVHDWVEPAFPPGWTSLVINEFLADNESVNQDETGACEDWAEIFNPGPDPVPLGGLFLSDDLDVPDKWTFPDTVIAPGGFLLVWCDSDPEDGPLHSTFKLAAAGEEIGLFDRIETGNGLIDGFAFGPQTADISFGRQPDGSETWAFFTNPTPGAPNLAPAPVPAAEPAGPTLRAAFPNPFNPRTTVAFDLPRPAHVRLSVHDARGSLVAVLVDADRSAGTHQASWNGLDKHGNAVAAGVYLLRMTAAGQIRTQRVVLLK